MKNKKSWEKKILLPGLLLSIAAMGILFLLQIRWMNNSLWSENMRYRKEVVDSVNRIGQFTMNNLELSFLNSSEPLISLMEWRLNSSYPELIKEVLLLDKETHEELLDNLTGNDLIYLTSSSEPRVAFLLDGTILYERILLENLQEYAQNYSFILAYREYKAPDPNIKNMDPDRKLREPVLSFSLPRIFDADDRRAMENLLSFGPERDDFMRGDHPGSLLPYLTINLNDSRGSEQFTLRLRRFNISLIVTLSLILLGSYSLLFKLYREEEKQRRAGQTFVASVSHELRTPIAVIKSASNNLSRGVVTQGEKVRSYGSMIGQEVERLNRMVESILYYSRLEGGEGTVKPLWEEVNPREYTKEILDSLELTYPDRIFDKELDGAPELVKLDKEAYRMIVENLLLNALIHSPDSPVRIRLESDFPFHWRLVVEDEGPGIPRNEQKGIFDPFVRGKLSVANQIKGSGLGLHLIKSAARGMGGTITLESPYEFPAGVEKRGSRFQLILPVVKESIQ